MGQRAPSSENVAFGMRLAAAREVQGLNQTQLAALIGVSLPRYHAWEHASALPNKIELYRKLCRHLDVTMDWLFFGDTAPLEIEMEEKLEAALTAIAADRGTTQKS